MSNYKKTLAMVLCASMLLGMSACDRENVEEQEEISEKKAIKIAKQFTDALIANDADTLKDLSKKISSSNLEKIEDFDLVTLYGEEDAQVYGAYFDKVKYEILEDDISIDGDEAEVPVEFSFIDVKEISNEEFDVEGWIEAIDDTSEYETLKVTYKLELDDDDLLVTNTDKIINKYNEEITNVYFYVNKFVFYDDAVTLDWGASEYEATDDVSFVVECSDEEGPNGSTLNIIVYDPSMVSVFEKEYEYENGTTSEYVFNAADIGKDYFEGGTYTLEVSTEDGSIYESETVTINEYVAPSYEVDPEVSSTKFNTYFAGFLDSDVIPYTMPTEDMLGTYDESTHLYTNKYFGIVIETPENVKNVAEQVKDEVLSDKVADTSLVAFPTDDTDFICAFIVTDIGRELTNEDDVISFLADCGSEYQYKTFVEVGSVTMYCATSTKQASMYLMISKDNSLIVIDCIGTDSAALEYYLTTFRAVY